MQLNTTFKHQLNEVETFSGERQFSHCCHRLNPKKRFKGDHVTMPATAHKNDTDLLHAAGRDGTN